MKKIHLWMGITAQTEEEYEKYFDQIKTEHYERIN